MHRGLCEEEEVRGVLVQHRDNVDQGGVVGPCLLRVDGEEFWPSGRRGGVRSMAKNCGLVCPSRGLEVVVRGGAIPVATYFVEGSMGEEDMWLSGSGERGLVRDWGGDPGGDCGKGYGVLVGGS